MANSDSFFAEQSEQSQIKAAIVTDYFWAWAGFMVGQQKQRPQYGQKLQYIDLFAGPGRYESGAKSTPLMILERAVNDPEISGRLCAIFNDMNEANTQSLEKEIKAIPGYAKLKNEPKIFTRARSGRKSSSSSRARGSCRRSCSLIRLVTRDCR